MPNVGTSIPKRGTPLPIYSYFCLKCDKEVERIVEYSDEEVQLCDDCGNRMEKLISLTARMQHLWQPCDTTSDIGTASFHKKGRW